MCKPRIKKRLRLGLETVFWAACIGLVTGCAANSPSANRDVNGDTIIVVNDSAANSTSIAAIPEFQPDEVVDSEQGVAGTEFDEADSNAAAPGLDVPGLSAQHGSLDEASKSLDELVVKAGPPGLPLIDPCKQYDAQYDSWLDRNQVRVYRTVCGATAWFDGFFGDRRFDQATGATYGRISVGGYWDERNGWDTRVRFRARFALPSLRERGSILIGRGDEQDLIDERNTSGGDPTPVPAKAGEEDSTFVGYGYDLMKGLSRNLSLSGGVRLDMPLEYIAKIKYRRVWQLSERNLLRLRPILYWKSEEGIGSTVNVDIDHVINSAFLFRWANFGNVSQYEEVEGVDWGTTFFLFQALSDKRALTYSTFARGETDAPVTFKNVGFEFRYRQRILRDWLFIEYIGGVSWPREFIDESRKANFGSGLRLEAYFGPAPDSWMR
jgi:hypothetical protein